MEAPQDSPTRLYARQSNAGSNRQDGSSVSQLVSTLIPVLAISTVIFIAFLIFRKRLARVYQPRSFIGSLRNWQRSPRQTAGLLGWRREYTQLKDEFVLGHASLDNYLWLRFFKMLAMMCLIGCFITWPVLFPVNATGTAPNINGLDILSFSHITPGPRYYAQVFVAWAFLSWVMFMITKESKFFVRLRQRYFLSPYMSSRISSRTVLFVNVPEEARNENYLRQEYAGVKSIWLVNVPEDLAEKVDDRDKAAAKLETGEIKMIQNHTKREMKREKKEKKKGVVKERSDPEQGTLVEVEKKDRPAHRLPKLKFLPIGKKVDTVDWSRAELQRLAPEVANEQSRLRGDRSHVQGACFIEFDTVQAAQTATFQATHIDKKDKAKQKMKMTPKELGTPPQDVIWKNTIKSFGKVKLLSAAGTAFVAFLCIFWSIPVAAIGAISNINYLIDKVPFLSFINSIPDKILGVVTGLLPAVLLAVLMLLVPIVCNIIARMFEPTEGAVQMKVQGWYFPFQVIQVFLVTTFASGAASVATQIINDPTTAASLLANNLPKASNFYISYFIIFGLMTTAMQFLNLVPLLFALFLGKILDKTPRKLFNRYANLAGLGWGALYPKFTNLGVVALSYSSIAPLVLGFATVGFFLLYLAFRYNTIFTLGTTASTRGESYARALQQLTVGIYLSEVCLIGLLAIGVASSKQSIGPLVLMIVFLIATIAWHIWLRRGLDKMELDMPGNSINSTGTATNYGYDTEKNTSNTGHLSKDGYEQTSQTQPHIARDEYDEAGDQLQLQNTPAGKVSMMARLKGYFTDSADVAAQKALGHVAPHLGSSPRAYTPQEHDEAYLHPAIISECPIVWIAKDKYGISQQEIRKTTEADGFTMTDKGAIFNDKGKVEWKQDDLREAPIWRDEPTY
ncbi:related to DUF221 domain protein [Ramularia collo-cygni]|uniref:Related to DUF221 domain protein n=1 Tax=Ramularia collo-cygni TaxID=112498 RepID=A0A2D3V7Z8_9PEZI|nr:related to DUF221 domain protein [Ramularia collo-cygni]CZT20887.1 related to DUF221 domain protein [Ramularia collo-cygni]